MWALFIILVSLTMTTFSEKMLFPLDAYMISCPTWWKNLGQTLVHIVVSLRACLKRLFRNEFFVESNNATLQHFLDLQCHAPQSYISQVLRTLKRSCSEQLFGPIKMSWFLADLLVKFIYSEKATKFWVLFWKNLTKKFVYL